MFATKVSRAPARLDIGSRTEWIRTSDEDRRTEQRGAPGYISLTSPLPAPSAAIATFPLPRSPLVQAKLRIGAFNDPMETEADSVANQVMRMSVPDVPSSGPVQIQRKCAACPKEEQESDIPSRPQIRRKCAHCEEEEKVLQKKSDSPSSSRQTPHLEAPPLVHQVLSSPGQPLAAPDLSFFQSRFGFDFSRVHIHNDRTAAESAHSVNALAYTSGSDIAFGAGQYQPGTEGGRRLLAHELTHVVQQTFGDRGYVRRLGDLSKVPRVLSCEIPPSNVPPGHEFVLFPNGGTSLGSAEKIKIGDYVDRYHTSGTSVAVRVDGFASEPGDDSLNWRLSCYRASTVKEELMRPSAAKLPGLPDASINIFMQGETREFGAEAQNRRATLFPRITGSSKDKSTDDKGKTTPQDTPKLSEGGGSAPTDAGVPTYRPSCAENPSCPNDYCLPFPIRQEALDDRAKDGASVLSTIATANPHAEALFDKYINNPGPAGDISSEYGGDFSSSRDTRGVSEQIHRLVQDDIKGNPPAFPVAGEWVTVDYEADPSKDALKQKFNELATAGLVFSDPFEVPGLIAGGVGKDQGFCAVGANTTGAQEDSRSARVSAQVFKNPGGDLIINPIVNYTVVDTLDFCPGNCGGFWARHLGNTVQMSRWEASGISGDVPFTVNFQGPSLIGAYNSED